MRNSFVRPRGGSRGLPAIRKSLTAGAILLRDASSQARLAKLGPALLLVEVLGAAGEGMLTSLAESVAPVLTGERPSVLFFDAQYLDEDRRDFRDALLEWCGTQEGLDEIHLLTGQELLDVEASFRVAKIHHHLERRSFELTLQAAVHSQPTYVSQDDW